MRRDKQNRRRGNRLYPALLLLAAGLSAGCDPLYGPFTKVDLPGSPDLACIGRVLASTEGPGKLQVETRTDTRFGLLPRFGTIRSTSYVWVYGTRPSAVLQIYEDGLHGWRYSNTAQQMWSPLPPEMQTAAADLVDRVDRRLTELCGLPLSAKLGHTRP